MNSQEPHFNFDIERDGPGIWFTLMFMAAHATTPGLRKVFLYHLYIISTKFPCEVCRIHFEKFVNKRKPKGESREELMRLIYDAHDAVNVAHNKKSPDYGEIEDFFLNGGGCSEGPCVVEKEQSDELDRGVLKRSSDELEKRVSKRSNVTTGKMYPLTGNQFRS